MILLLPPIRLRRYTASLDEPDSVDVSSCKTVAEAVAIFEKEYNAKVSRYDGSRVHIDWDSSNPKYFFCEDLKTKGNHLIDIHIYRDNEYGLKDHICIRQDMNNEIKDGDEISLGELVC